MILALTLHPNPSPTPRPSPHLSPSPSPNPTPNPTATATAPPPPTLTPNREQNWFERGVFGLILLSSFALILEGPDLDDTSDLAHVLKALDWLFTVLFTLEFLLMLTVKGAWAYVRCFFNPTARLLQTIISNRTNRL